jgi:4-amino-4-deoxy-L-arabinose transferase
MYVSSDQYLHTWDERYHALVAKNLVKHPLKPTLYDNPVLPYDPENWVANHIWLDKGPVPLWAMAASMSIFGFNEFALRLPSLVVSLLSVWFTFMIGRLLFGDRIGLLAAFLHAINGLVIEVAGGRVSSDHVETFFCFFTEGAMLLALFTVMKNKGIGYALAIGIFTGLAILCKWSPALVVFPLWVCGEWLAGNKPAKSIAMNLLVAALACMAVAGPWFWYIHHAFPDETAYVFSKFTNAYSETLEKHTGPWYYYFKNTGMVFGELVWIALLFTAYLIIRQKAGWQVTVLLLWWFIPFVVFSFAETKRHTYLLIAAPALFCLTANAYFYLKQACAERKWISVLLLLALIGLPVRYCIERTKPFTRMELEPQWAADLKKMNGKYPPNTVFVNHPHAIEGMFYTDYIFYGHTPDTFEIKILGNSGFEVIQAGMIP